MSPSGIAICALALVASGCSKSTEVRVQSLAVDDFSPKQGSSYNLVYIQGKKFGYQPAQVTVQFNGLSAEVLAVLDTTLIVAVPPDVTTGRISVSTDNQTVSTPDDFVVLPGKWIRQADLPTNQHTSLSLATAFSIDGKGYYVGGANKDGARYPNLYAYDPSSNSWSEKTPFPLEDIVNGVGFVIDHKAYVGIGRVAQATDQLWEYDPQQDDWTQKSNFPGGPRDGAVGFAVNGFGYVGAGDSLGTHMHDWYRYDPIGDQWTSLTSFPGSAMSYPSGFVLNNEIFLLNGFSQSFWKYSPSTDSWTHLNDFAGNGAELWNSAGFVVGTNGYIAGGTDQCWKYFPATDVWTETGFYGVRQGVSSFTIDNTAYCIGGLPTGSCCNLDDPKATDMWEFVSE